MKASIRSFKGMRPGVAVDLLDVGEAANAVNTLLTGGDLTPVNQPLDVTTLNSAAIIRSIYRYGQASNSDTQFWFQSTTDADFVKGPVNGDTYEQTYYTGVLSYPAKTRNTVATVTAPYPTNSVPLGLQKPSVAPSVVVSGTPTNASDPAETVTFVMTLISDWGEEGPPSDPAVSVSWKPGQTLTVTLPISGVASYPGNANKSQSYVGKRLYRSAVGSGSTARWLLVNKTGDIPLATTNYVDTATTATLGEALKTSGWVEPPDGMLGLTSMANGVMAGFSGSTVCFCEPFVPYAWPVRYQQSVDAPVVGIKAFDQSLLVATTRSLYLMTGADPASITSERMAVPQTCVSKRSMVQMMGGVIFATPDGLGFVGPGGFRMLTDGLMTRREWRAYAPSSIHAYESDTSYIAFFDTGGRQAGMMFRFGSDPSFCETDFYCTAGFRDPSQDALYLCTVGTGSTRSVVKWEYGTPMTQTWESGEFRTSAAMNIAAARVDFTGTVSFTLLADGAAVYGPATVTSTRPFKLPGGYRARRFRARVIGTGTVRAIEFATSVKEITG